MAHGSEDYEKNMKVNEKKHLKDQASSPISRHDSIEMEAESEQVPLPSRFYNPAEQGYKVAIFDFDGTLVDTVALLAALQRETIRAVSGEPISMEDISYIDGSWYAAASLIVRDGDVPSYFIARHSLSVSPEEYRVERHKIGLPI